MKKRKVDKLTDFWRWCALCKDYFIVGEHDHEIHIRAAQQSVQLTALRRGLAVSIFINVILLAVVAFTIGGN